MTVPARFKWHREDTRFVAHPVGTGRPGRLVAVHLGSTGLNTSVEPHRPVQSWHWLVKWEGWFAKAGVAATKQSAADMATEEWWRLVVTEMPRDVDTEIDVIVARILVMPPPNSIMTESTVFLQRLNRQLFLQFKDEIKAEAAPMPVRNLLANLSAELYRRRLAGETEETTHQSGAT